MPGADLRLAKQKRRVVPPAVESVGDRVGDAGHLGFVPAESVDHGRRVREQFGPVELEMIGGEREVRAVLLQDMHEPMGKLEVTVSGALGLPQPLQERLVADAVQLARDRFDADVRAHGRIPLHRAFKSADHVEPRVPAERFVGLRPIGRHPACPPDLRVAAEPDRSNLARRNSELHVPVVFETEVEKHRIGDLLRDRRAGQKLAEMLDVSHEDSDAKLVADGVHARARDAILAEAAVGRAEARALASVKLEPTADEFLDLDARLEVTREKCAQTGHALDARGEQAGIGQLGEIGDRVGVAKRRCSDADHRADIGAEAVFVGPIVLSDRARVRPGAKEQRQKTALEEVGETRKRVVPFEKPIVRFFRRGQRQGPLRAEHAKEPGLEEHAPAWVDLRGLEVRVGEFKVGVLRDLDEFVRKPARLANARFGRVFPFEAPQNAEQIEAPGLGCKLRAEGHRRPLKPRRGGQRIISPRSTVRMIVWVKWLIAIYSAKKRARMAPSRKAPEPSNARPSSVSVISSPRAAAAPDAWRSRRTVGRVVRLRTPRIFASAAASERSANRTSVSRSALAPSSARSASPKWLRLKMLMRRQATSPVDGSSPLPSIEVSAGSSGLVGPATQVSSSSESSRKRRSAPLSPTGR